MAEAWCFFFLSFAVFWFHCPTMPSSFFFVLSPLPLGPKSVLFMCWCPPIPSFLCLLFGSAVSLGWTYPLQLTFFSTIKKQIETIVEVVLSIHQERIRKNHGRFFGFLQRSKRLSPPPLRAHPFPHQAWWWWWCFLCNFLLCMCCAWSSLLQPSTQYACFNGQDALTAHQTDHFMQMEVHGGNAWGKNEQGKKTSIVHTTLCYFCNRVTTEWSDHTTSVLASCFALLCCANEASKQSKDTLSSWQAVFPSPVRHHVCRTKFAALHPQPRSKQKYEKWEWSIGAQPADCWNMHFLSSFISTG